MNNGDGNKTENELLEQSQNEQQPSSHKRTPAQGIVKGLATEAGAAIGGKTGANIGSKVGDVINNQGFNRQPIQEPDKVSDNPKTGNQLNPKNNAVPNVSLPQNNELQEPSLHQDTKEEKDANNLSNRTSKKLNQTPTQPRLTGSKNPTQNKYANILKKHSKHANGSNDDNKEDNQTANSKEQNPLKKIGDLRKKSLFPTKNKNNSEEEPETEEEAAKKDIKQFVNVLKFAAGLVSSFMGALGAIGTFIITHIVLISIILVVAVVITLITTIISFVVSFFQYGREEDGTVCYTTPSCNQIVIKSEEGDKTYSLEDYIAGAIVNYYDHDSYAVPDADVDQNLLKAFSVIIHSDIAAYSDYEYTTETCTVTDNSRFKDIYTPNIDENQDIENDNNSENTDDTATDETTDSSTEQTEEELEKQKKYKYYTQAKTAATSVISEVVDIYTQRIDIFYDGYIDIINTAYNIQGDYKSIAREYIKNSPDYSEVINDNITSEGSADDTTDDNDGEPIGIYPVCGFSKSNQDNTTTPIVFANDICSTVHINSGSNKGDHTIEEFIAGAVYGEIGSWSNYPELLKAQAVAARTYLVGRSRVENGVCYIDVGGDTLGYKADAPQVIIDAVKATEGEYLMKNGKRLTAAESQFDALCIEDGYVTNTTSEYYTLCQKGQKILKSWLNPKLTNSLEFYYGHKHGIGMSQYGAYYLAREEGKNYKEILKYYYDADVSIVSSKDYIMPINTFKRITGETTGRCRAGEKHKGIDFSADVGTPIYAAHSGVVVRVYDNGDNCYPNCDSTAGVGIGFKIDHQDGTYSMYMHMSQRIDLHKGDTVTAGQLIGYVGNTGSSDGAHLHFGLFNATTGSVLNPRDYLPLDEKGYGVCYNFKK